MTVLPQRSALQRYHSENILSEFYPQDGGESQWALKLRHRHPMYTYSFISPSYMVAEKKQK